MRQIRENIWMVTHSELGKPFEKGVYEVPGLGKVHLDHADEHYIREAQADGYEPTFFVSMSDALVDRHIVVSRQRTSIVPGIPSGERAP